MCNTGSVEKPIVEQIQAKQKNYNKLLMAANRKPTSVRTELSVWSSSIFVLLTAENADCRFRFDLIMVKLDKTAKTEVVPITLVMHTSCRLVRWPAFFFRTLFSHIIGTREAAASRVLSLLSRKNFITICMVLQDFFASSPGRTAFLYAKCGLDRILTGLQMRISPFARQQKHESPAVPNGP